MAPIEPDLSRSNLRSLGILLVHPSLIVALTSFLGYYGIYGAYRSLPPSQQTRLRASNRKKQLAGFAGLAALSFIVLWYHSLEYMLLSYRAWANEMDGPIPTRLRGRGGIFGDGSVGVDLGRWLRDTNLVTESAEIIVERSKRYWWSQQLVLGGIPWSIFLGVEGQKRNISHLWAYMLLGQALGISFAMNLFFFSILVTPLPLPDSGSSTTLITTSSLHAQSSTSHVITTNLERSLAYVNNLTSRITSHLPASLSTPIILIPLLTAFTATFLLPYTTSTPTFTTLCSILALTLILPVYFPPTNPHLLYSLTTLLSLLLHAKQTITALLDNDPGAYLHRHSAYLSTLHLPHSSRSAASRSASATSRVLSALNDHPAVSIVGWDVLLCAVSLCLWATVRNIPVSRILRISTGALLDLFFLSTSKSSPSSSSSALEKKPATPETPISPARRSTRRRKSTAKARKHEEDEDYEDSTASPVPDGVDGEVPMGEENVEADLESGAVGWAVFVLGGLGVLAGGVLSAEVEER